MARLNQIIFRKPIAVFTFTMVISALLILGANHLGYSYSPCPQPTSIKIVLSNLSAVLPHNRQVISAENVSSLKKVASLEQTGASRWKLAFDSSSSILAIGGENESPDSYVFNCGSTWLWDLSNPSNEPRVFLSPNGSSISSNVLFSPDGNLLVTTEGGASGNLNLRLWDVALARDVMVQENVNERAVDFSPDCTLLAYGDNKGKMQIWNINTEREVAIIKTPETNISSVQFSPDGKLLASASDNVIRIWETKSFTNIHVLRDHTGYIVRLAFNIDGSLLASNSFDGTIRIWNTDNFVQLNSLTVSTWNLMFAPVSTYIAADSGVWNVRNTELEINFDDIAVSSVAFNPSGDLIIVGDKYGKFHLFDARHKTNIINFQDNNNPVRDLLFSPDGTLIASLGAASDGIVHVWAVGNSK